MIYLGADHGGFALKEKIKGWLSEWGYKWEDMGNIKLESGDDYPLYANAVAEKVAPKQDAKGILACRSAAGMVIAANKVKGARCAAAFDEKSAEHSRTNNDANILAVSGDWMAEGQAKKVIKVWLETQFSGAERHQRRLREIEAIEKRQK